MSGVAPLKDPPRQAPSTFVATLERLGVRIEDVDGTPAYAAEFWGQRKRAAHSLHEVSYRACFKPELVQFFVSHLTAVGDTVHDPFMGRGTTPIQAALMDRRPAGNDAHPIAKVFCEARLSPPRLPRIETRLKEVDWQSGVAEDEDLLVFFHKDTLREIDALRRFLLDRAATGLMDDVDRWIQMVAINRMTGHSQGFFSVYSLPPNQAPTANGQRRINARLGNTPPYREVASRILRKSHQLRRDLGELHDGPLPGADRVVLSVGDAASTPHLADGSVALVVTSPPFLNVIAYRTDHWLRSWFCGITRDELHLSLMGNLDAWRTKMTDVLREQHRLLRPSGHVAFEVGEVRKGALRLEAEVPSCGRAAGLVPIAVVIQDTSFTKTANCWGIANNKVGTNSNRIIVFRKDG